MKFRGFGFSSFWDAKWCSRCGSRLVEELRDTGRYSERLGVRIVKRRKGCPERVGRFFSRHTLTDWE